MALDKLDNLVRIKELKAEPPDQREFAGMVIGQIKALAEVHAELVLIHPFREGNGRCARLLASIMALQARLPVLDFSSISGLKTVDYFTAVQIGIDRNYDPMETLFVEIIENSIQASSR